VTARTAVPRLPTGPGVYRFRDARGRVLYIGRASNLRSRVGSYWGDLRDRRHLTPMVPAIARIEAVCCASRHEAAWLERNLHEARLPYWNRTAGGAEVPVYLRLDDRLRVVHERTAGARCFGPYLGGLQMRTAVAALHRALPLAYAAAGLRGAEAEMARALGVATSDRVGLRAAIVAVLERDPAAVATIRTELVRRREAAAAAQGFERAGRLQDEIAALDWTTAEQRVTALEPYDADVYGWSGGLLVRFEIRAGRLSGWTQRRCGAETGAARVAATPPLWVDFAQQNAELAATLALN